MSQINVRPTLRSKLGLAIDMAPCLSSLIHLSSSSPHSFSVSNNLYLVIFHSSICQLVSSDQAEQRGHPTGRSSGAQHGGEALEQWHVEGWQTCATSFASSVVVVPPPFWSSISIDVGSTGLACGSDGDEHLGSSDAGASPSVLASLIFPHLFFIYRWSKWFNLVLNEGSSIILYFPCFLLPPHKTTHIWDEGSIL